MNEINVVILASSREAAEAYLRKNNDIKAITYSRRLRHGDYIVASTFVNPDDNN